MQELPFLRSCMFVGTQMWSMVEMEWGRGTVGLGRWDAND